MTTGKRNSVAAIAVVCVALSTSHAFGQTKPKGDPKGTPITKAITALTKEYRDFVKEPNKNKLRDQSNYFADALAGSNEPPADLQAEQVVSALERQVSGDPTEEAYVKWQLLSAMPSRLSDKDKLATRLFAVYHRAPNPLPRPGMSSADQARLKALVTGREATPNLDQSPAYRDWLAVMARYTAFNDPIISYRDLLFNRLPQRPPTFGAGFDDLFERIATGATTRDFQISVCKAIGDWSHTDGTKPEIAQMIASITALQKSSAGKSTTYLTTLRLDNNSKKWGWDSGKSEIDGEQLKKLLKQLEDSAKTGGIQIRDPKDRGN